MAEVRIMAGSVEEQEFVAELIALALQAHPEVAVGAAQQLRNHRGPVPYRIVLSVVPVCPVPQPSHPRR